MSHFLSHHVFYGFYTLLSTARLFYTPKSVLIQALLSQLSVEALYVLFIHRFSWSSEYQLTSSFISPVLN
jgi:hypothetical protein